MKVVKVVDTEKKYQDKSGKERSSVNYYIVADNGKWIAIRPSFGNGYVMLDVICESVKNG